MNIENLNINTNQDTGHKVLVNKYSPQVQPPWEEFDKENIDADFNRKSPSPEQIEEIDTKLTELSDLFKDCDLNWHIDGAINISLLNKEYIGNHKDIDISVEENELPQLQEHLLINNYGLFVSRTEPETKNKIFQQVDVNKNSNFDKNNIQIVAIDGDGKIDRDRLLNFVDLHLIHRNENGEAITTTGVKIPKKWTKPFDGNISNKKVNISHPGKVLYYKLQQGRGYDQTDIDKLINTGFVQISDIDDIHLVIKESQKENIIKGQSVASAISERINEDMEVSEIQDIIKNQAIFSKINDSNPKLLHVLAENIKKKADFSPEGILEVSLDLFKVNENNEKILKKLNSISKSIQKQLDISELKSKI